MLSESVHKWYDTPIQRCIQRRRLWPVWGWGISTGRFFPQWCKTAKSFFLLKMDGKLLYLLLLLVKGGKMKVGAMATDVCKCWKNKWFNCGCKQGFHWFVLQVKSFKEQQHSCHSINILAIIHSHHGITILQHYIINTTLYYLIKISISL